MKDEYKTKKQLINELKGLRQRVDKLEKMKAGRKRAEGALQRESNLLSRIMETSPAGITLVNKQGNIIFANPQAEQVLGLTKDEITQRAYNDPEWRITDYDGNLFPDKEMPFRRVMTTNQPVFDVRHAIEWPNGNRVLLSVNAAPLFDDSGKFDGMVATVEDITEQVRTEEEILKARRDWEDIFQAIGHPTLILDPEHNVIVANRAAVKAAGVTEEKLLGKKCYEVFHGTDRAPEGCPLKKIMVSGHLETVEMEMEALGGVFFVSCTPVFDEKGHLHRVIHIATDITERKQAETKLKESEYLYRTLTENSLTGIFMLREGYYLFANEMHSKMFGYSWDDLKSMDPLDLIAPECREQISERVKKRLAGEDVLSDYETKIICKDGIVRDVHIKATRIIFEGKPTILGNTIDITERKQAEAKLKESEYLYRTLTENSLTGISMFGEGDYLFANEMYCKMFGYSWEELKFMDPLNVVAPEYREQMSERVKKRLAGEDVLSDYETKIIRKDGVTRDVHFKATRIMYEGKATVLGSLIDITERKRSEEALRESEEKYRLVVENAKEAIFVAQDRMLKFINRETEEITGYSSEELTSRPFIDLIHPDDQEMVVGNHQKRLRGEAAPPVYPFRIVGKDGKTKWGEGNAVVISWDGRPATLNFLRDITERKRTENLIRTQHDLILALSAATGLDEGLRLCVDAALQVSEMDNGGIYLVNETSGALDLFFNKGLEPDFVRNVSHFDADSANARLVMAGEPVYTECQKLGFPLNGAERYPGLRAIAILPIRHEDRPIGCLIIASHSFDEVPVFSRVALETIAAQIGSSITRLKAEEALKASEDKYRTLVESSTDAILMMDEERRVVSCNRAFLSLFGYAKNEIEGKSIRVIHPSDDSFNTFGDLAYPTIDEVGFFRGEWDFVRKDGLGFPAETVTSAIKSPDGLTVGFVAIMRDLTERKRAEEALHTEKQRFQTLSEHAPFGVVMIDKEGTFKYINPKFRELFGYDLTDVPNGKTWFRKAYPDSSYRDHVIGTWIKDLESFKPGEKRDEIFTVTCKEGAEKTIHFIPVQLETGENLMACEDITERKRAEEALRESEEKYRSLVANATDAIFIVQDGRIKFPNPITLRLTGYSQEELATFPFINLIHPEDRAMVLDNYTRRLKGEEVLSTYTFRVINKRGEELWGQLNAVVIAWEGRPAILCFIRDITPQKRLEAQYLHAQKMEAVGILAGGIAHDFNNLLQAVLGYTEILLLHKEKLEHGYQELQEIKRAAQRGSELTQRLLTFSRRVPSKLRPVNLNQEINQIQKLLQRTIPKMIDIELTLTDDLRTVNGDPAQIEQALMNLAVNARDAMPEGGKLVIGTKNITLDEEYCKMHLGVKPGEYVLLTVTDTGCGMEKETLEHLFEPFYTTKGIGRGTGLGLSMVYGIVKSHDAYILCGSQVGKGTTFEIYLPVIEQRLEMEKLKEEKIPMEGKETILLIDDDESIRDLGNQILNQFGYTVLTASDGESGLELYRKEKGKIDLVILDLIMPGMGGRKCLEELLKMNPEVKVVIASGYSVDGPAKEALEVGAKNFVSKPYAMRQMLKVVREVLDKNA